MARVAPAAEAPSTDPAERPRVLMVVANPCTHDTRVIKEAEALCATGYQVRVLCRARPGLVNEEVRNGVEYRRVDMDPALQRWRRRAADRRAGKPSSPATNVVPGGKGDPSVPRERREGPLWNAVRGVLHLVRAVLTARVLRARVHAAAQEFRPAVIHAHDLAPLPGAVRAAGKIGSRVVYDAHELERHRNGLRGVKRLLTALTEIRNIRKADAVITVCDSIAAWLAENYRIARPVVVMNAPEATRPGPLARTLRDDVGVDAAIPLGVYVGKLTFNRGLEEVIDAAALWPELHLALVGPRNPRTVTSVTRRAHERGVAGRVHLVESVPPGDVVSYVASADFGLVPTQDACLSYRFSLPNKLFEMTFAGLPIVASDLPEQRAFLERIGNGLVMDERDPEDIARAMREAYSRRSALVPGREAAEVMERHYTWAAQVSKLSALYSRLDGCRMSG